MIIDIEHTFVSADQYFRHENVIKYCNRPFKHVEEMDAALIRCWNEVIEPADIVYCLGDFTLGKRKEARRYFAQLNGRIKVLGNRWHHDRRWLPATDGKSTYLSKSGICVEILPPLIVLKIPVKGEHPTAIVLCHYPLAEWDRKHHGAYHFHAHSHGNYRGDGLVADVGVDCCDFYPVSLADAMERARVNK